jgi:class 3 adenylate cyclase
MESQPPQPVGPGQRMLAAIVFTDTVNFSARMQAEEVVTLDLLKRDFAVMRTLCEKYSGVVLKTTGDGLLLSFSSAVQAVSYAQKMQRYFAETAKTQTEEETLTHRVGIHLGDVFFNDNDVMGDGVNIAARLQSEAEPGGICISQTVYDVVMNKLKLEVVKLGPRELKNISQTVPMYSVVLKPQKLRPRLPENAVNAVSTAARVAPASTAVQTPFALSGMQKLLMVVALLVVLGLLARWAIQANSAHDKEMAKSKATIDAVAAAVLAEKTTVSDPDFSGEKPSTAPVSDLPKQVNYDFSKMTGLQPVVGKTGLSPEEDLVRQQANELLRTLLAWMNGALSGYTKDHPLLVRELPGSISSQTSVFSGPDHRLFFAEGGAIRQRKLTDLKPAVLGAVIISVLLDSPSPPAGDVLRGAEAFAYLYGLPQLNEAMRDGNLTSGKK